VGADTPREKARLERVFAWLGLDMRFWGCFEGSVMEFPLGVSDVNALGAWSC
jgi:hypothetical protein